MYASTHWLDSWHVPALKWTRRSLMNEPQPTLQQRIAASKELQQAQRDGIDLQLLWDNMQRPVSERIRRHQIALDTLNQLRRARKL